MNGANATDPRGQLQGEHTRVLVARIRIGLWVLIFGRVAMALADLRTQSTTLVPLMAIGIVLCGALGSGIVMLRRCESRRRAIAIALVAATASWMAVAMAHVLRHDSTTVLPLIMLLVIGAAVLIPWGAGPQLINVLAAELAILGNALAVHGSLAPAFGYLGVAMLLTGALSVYLAHQFERARMALVERELDRERSRETLRRSETALLGLFDHLEDIFYRTDLQGTLQIVSPSVARYGYAAEGLVGRDVTALYRDPAQRVTIIDALLARGSLSDHELTLQRADGTPVPFSMSAQLLHDAEGRPAGAQGLLRDISLRKRQQEQMSALLEVAKDIGGTVELGEMFNRVQRRTSALLPCDRVAILSWDARRRRYTLLSQYGTMTEPLATTAALEFPSGTPFTDQLWQARSVVVEAAGDPSGLELLAAFRATALAAIPLHVRGRAIGALVAMRDDSTGGFDAPQLELLEGIACHLGMAIDASETLSSVSPIGVFRVDADGYCLYINERCSEILGVTPAEALGKSWGPSIHPDDRERIAAELARARQNRVPFKCEYRLCAPGGVTTWVLGQALVENGPDGQIIGYVGTVIDITERKRAEEALQESEARYREIFSAAPVSIWEEDFSRVKALVEQWRAAGVCDFRAHLDAHPALVRQAVEAVRVVDVNEESLKLFGAKTKAELLASLSSVFVAETLAAFKEEILAIANGYVYFESDTCVQTLQGERRDVMFTMSFPQDPARFDRVLVTVIDVTERKRAERSLAMAERDKQDAVHAAADAERRRVARELHDGVLQDLGATKLLLEAQRKRAPSPEADQVLQRLRQSLDDIRSVVDDLRTPDATLSLQDAIAAHARVMTAHSLIALDLQLQPISVVDWAVRDLYRIAQEAIGNVVRHAHSRHVMIELCSEKDETTLRIADDGHGFDLGAPRVGNGLLGMRERAASLGAELEITSAPGCGTTLRVVVPHGRAPCAMRSAALSYTRPERIRQSLVADRGGRKVRTPEGRVAANGGPERSGESATERRRPRDERGVGETIGDDPRRR